MNQGGLKMGDRVRIELAVRRVDWVLDGRVPWRRRRQIRDELRANLYEAARDVGAVRAVNHLGDLRTLGRTYLDMYRGRFDFRIGTWAAIAAYAAIQVVSIAVFFAFVAGLAAAHGQGASYSFWAGLGPFGGAVLGPSPGGFEFVLASPAHLLLMAAAFTIGSTYRLLFRRR